jgi:hypothetical protein
MFTVTLYAFVQDPSSGRALAAERTIELPTAPFVGLDVVLSDVLHFQIARVEYDVRDKSWHVECEDEILGSPLSSLEHEEAYYREAGFTVTAHDLTAAERERRRHLRPVR